MSPQKRPGFAADRALLSAKEARPYRLFRVMLMVSNTDKGNSEGAWYELFAGPERLHLVFGDTQDGHFRRVDDWPFGVSTATPMLT